jgi:hypothetical protein
MFCRIEVDRGRSDLRIAGNLENALSFIDLAG